MSNSSDAPRRDRRVVAVLSVPGWRAVALALTVLLVLAAPAQAGQDQTAQDSMGEVAQAVDAGDTTVRVAIRADEGPFNPFVPHNDVTLGHDLTMLVYDSLFWSQSEVAPDTWLATDAIPSADFRTWTVSLRPGVLWHDGEPFTAEDVAFTFGYFRDVGGPGRYGHHVYQHPVFQTATVIDDLTVELAFANPIATFPQLPGGDLPILPEHVWSAIGDPRTEAPALPVGTGPYRFVDHQPGVSYRLEANQVYFQGPPLVSTLELLVVPGEQAFAELEAGNVDMVARSTPLAWIEQLDLNEEVEMLVGSRQQSVHLQFNLGNELLANADVRRGLGLAIDVDIVLDAVEEGAGRLGTDTWTHPNSIWTRDPLGAHLSDAAASLQLLQANGFTSGADGALLTPAGQPAMFTLGVDETRPRHASAAVSVVAQLATIGVGVTIQPLPTATLPPRVGGRGTLPPTDLVIGELETHNHDDPDHLYFLFHSTSAATDLFGGYQNPELDAAIEQLMFEPQESLVRTQALNTAQDILAADLPVMVLYYPAWRMAYRPAAYDGWQAEEANGFLTKRSLLPVFADQGQGERTQPPPSVPAFQSAAADQGDGWGLRTPLALGVSGLALAGAIFLIIRNRPTYDLDDEEWME